MKLLITGGTGFIGSQLALEARALQHDIVVTGCTHTEVERSRLRDLEAVGIRVTTGSLEDRALTRALVEGCDAVIHLAAAQHEANVPDSHFRTINVDATRGLIDASIQAGVRRFVYGSTIGVYGSAGGVMVTEETPTQPANIYGITKLEAEQVVKSRSDRIETTVIRISETYGPGDRRLLKLFKSIDSGAFAMIGSGLNLHQPIHVHDLVRGLLTAAEHPDAVGNTFLLAGPASLTTRTMVNEIAAALDRSPRTLRVPLWPVALAARWMEAVFKPLGIQPPLHRRRLDFFQKSFWFSNAKAKAVLGFEPTISFLAGAADAAAWYRGRGLLKPPRTHSVHARIVGLFNRILPQMHR
jgi:dihydroflavonol-4-reductase